MDKNQSLLVGGAVVLALILAIAVGTNTLYLGAGYTHVDKLKAGDTCQITTNSATPKWFSFREWDYANPPKGTINMISWWITNHWTTTPFPYASGYAEYQEGMSVTCTGGVPANTCTAAYQLPSSNNGLPCCTGYSTNIDGWCMPITSPTPTPIVPTPTITPQPTPYCANVCPNGQTQAGYPDCRCIGGTTPTPTIVPPMCKSLGQSVSSTQGEFCCGTLTPQMTGTGLVCAQSSVPSKCGNSLGVLCGSDDTTMIFAVLALVVIAGLAIWKMRGN